MREFLGIGIAFSLIILTACQGVDMSQVSDADLARITGKAIVCNEPYMRFGTSCCLDKNNNDICDNDEQEEATTPISNIKTEDIYKEVKPSCTDECSSDYCKGFDFISCQTKENGCKDKVDKGKIKGKCNVECLSGPDCKSTEQCDNFGCIPKVVQETASTTPQVNIPIEDTNSETDELLNKLKKGIEDLNEELKKTSAISVKISECAKLWAGESDVPYLIIEGNNACSNVYFYGGEKELDDYINGLRK